ncbi:MAG: alpha/beta hydrolase-fold protein [Saprospiraceae bacterium]
MTSYHLSFNLSTPDVSGEPICIAGSFNDWKEHEYQMKQTAPGEYKIEFNIPSNLKQPIEYKFLRTHWANVELDEFGSVTENRVIDDPGEPIRAWVPRWRVNTKVCDTDLEPIKVFHEMVLPRTRKKRRISVLLPYDYYQSHKKYPVLYLMDGQNLFEEGAPFGSWHVHKRMAVLAEKNRHEVIIVCIDHAGKKRIEEFNYIRHYQTEPGRGHLFIDWIVGKLKPMIDKTYRSHTDPSNTGIGGSSMGGLISLMAGITRPEVFGKLMIFSPSLWKILDMLYDRMMYLPLVSHDQYIYLYAGGKEAANMKGFATDFYQQFKSIDPGNDRIHFSVVASGQHNEKFWGKEFPFALKYLFF